MKLNLSANHRQIVDEDENISQNRKQTLNGQYSHTWEKEFKSTADHKQNWKML